MRITNEFIARAIKRVDERYPSPSNGEESRLLNFVRICLKTLRVRDSRKHWSENDIFKEFELNLCLLGLGTLGEIFEATESDCIVEVAMRLAHRVCMGEA